MKSIKLAGLSDKDHIVFSSLVSLLKLKTDEEWDIVENDSANVVVVDVDSENGLKLCTNLESRNVSVVRFSHHPPTNKEGKFYLKNPLRAHELLGCLNEITLGGSKPIAQSKPSSNENVSISPEAMVKLIRWPDKKTLTNNKHAARICALLMKKPMNLERVANVGNISVDSVIKFCTDCQALGILEIVAAQTTTQPVAERKHSRLFSLLRLKLGER